MLFGIQPKYENCREMCFLSNGSKVSHLDITLKRNVSAKLVNENGRKWKLSEKCVILAPPLLVLLTKCDKCIKLTQTNSLSVIGATLKIINI